MLTIRLLIRGFTFVVPLLCSWTVLAVAQNCPSCTNPDAEELSARGIKASTISEESTTDNREAWTIHKRVDEVTVFFTVRKGHKYVDDLTATDVRVLDDHQPVEKLSSFGRQTDVPLRLGLLVDTSDSVEYRFRFEKDVSSQFLRTVVRPGMDHAFVMGFSVYSTLTSDYTDDHRQLTAGVSALRSGGDTALFDAVVQVCEKLAGGEGDSPVARVLVILSDGVDNSSKTTLDEAIECAQRREVTIYSISTNDAWMVQPGDSIMNRLGVETGGRMFRPKANSDMVNAFSSIEREMRSRYAISYHPRVLAEDGRYHGIDIIAERSHKKLHVDARKGYYAPLAESSHIR
jgi:Ca-activated chloride channel family protein